MPVRIYECNECKSRFMRPMKGACPFCGNKNFEMGKPLKKDLRYMGQEKDGKFLYKDADTGKEKWLNPADEAIKEQIKPTETADDEITVMNKRLNKKKRQSEYHKKRYALMKTGKWEGHLKDDPKN